MECILHNVTGKLFWVSSASTYFTTKYERSKEISSKDHKLKNNQRSYKCQYYIYDLRTDFVSIFCVLGHFLIVLP